MRKQQLLLRNDEASPHKKRVDKIKREVQEVKDLGMWDYSQQLDDLKNIQKLKNKKIDLVVEKKQDITTGTLDEQSSEYSIVQKGSNPGGARYLASESSALRNQLQNGSSYDGMKSPKYVPTEEVNILVSNDTTTRLFESNHKLSQHHKSALSWKKSVADGVVVPKLNLSNLSTSIGQGGLVTYRDIESKVFQDVFDTFRSNNIDVKENISQLAKLVKDQSSLHYSKQKRLQKSLMEFKKEDFVPLSKSFVKFELQVDRPEIPINQAHEHRFNYFDKNKISNLSKNSKEKNFDFDKMLARKSLFQINSEAPISTNDEKALSQRIKQGESYKNDLPSDYKDYFKPNLRNHSINFDKQFIRDGVYLRRNGHIITNKGAEIDINLLDEDDPARLLNQFQDSHNEEVRKIKNPDLDPAAAFKRTAAFKKGYRNIYFSKQQYRDKQKFEIKVPSYMQNIGYRSQLSVQSDKGIEMNMGAKQSQMGVIFSGFDNQTQSALSKQRYKNIIRNRQQQLSQYFPKNQKAVPSQSAKPEELDFLALLKSAGFIKKSPPQDLLKDGGASLKDSKPWRLPKIQPLTDDLEVLNDDSDY